MADRQWMITKVGATIVSILLIVSSGIGAANLVTSLRRDVDRNEESIDKHESVDEKNWDKVWEEVDDNADEITELKLQNTRLEQNQIEILRRIDENRNYYEKLHGEIMNFMRNFEVDGE